ncbi:subtilase cytotoxin subunit B, partial [Salmonella enterica]|nr:subtilase cytotoxin subunit B [Salmonella enterica]
MYINKFVPVYTLLILIYSFNASAEWTGDKTNAYYSDEVISELHVGQIDTGPYFCIKTVKANGSGTPVVACAVSKQSIWAPSFKELLDQARYFYSTGQSVRIHVQKNIWTYPLFVNAFSANALVGLSSCSA